MQVVQFGSVPLKTYLPDGDIDLTALSHNTVLKETWAGNVQDVLREAEQNVDAEFRVKEVQYIHADVSFIMSKNYDYTNFFWFSHTFLSFIFRYMYRVHIVLIWISFHH